MMASERNLGVMVTIDDHHTLEHLDVNFFEVLVKESDTPDRLEEFLARVEKATIVHSPEKMRIDGKMELIDLADPDPHRRELFAARIGEVASAAAKHGVATVVHPGGVHDHPEKGEDLHHHLVESLDLIDGTLWIENMPRRYHAGRDLLYCNLLKHPEEFKDLLHVVDGITLDICHAYLSADKGGNSAIGAFFEQLRDHVRHIHMSDASYPHNEGMQLGKGDIDFTALPRPGSIPILLEVWDGHLNGGEGYNLALEKVRQGGIFKGCIP